MKKWVMRYWFWVVAPHGVAAELMTVLYLSGDVASDTALGTWFLFGLHSIGAIYASIAAF